MKTIIPYQIIEAKNRQTLVLFYFSPDNENRPSYIKLREGENNISQSTLLYAITKDWSNYGQNNCELVFMSRLTAQATQYDILTRTYLKYNSSAINIEGLKD